MPNEFETQWAEGETPPATNAAEALIAEREAKEAETANEFAQAFEADEQKEATK